LRGGGVYNSRTVFRIAVLAGDGIGPEVVAQALKALHAASKRFDFRFEAIDGPVGGASIDRHGVPLTRETLEACRAADAVLFGAIGGPRWDALPGDRRPEAALLALRRELGAFANLRPARVPDALAGASTLKPEIVRGVDLMIVRELTGGIYFGAPRGIDAGRAFNTMVYTADEIRRVARVAFELAAARRRRVTSVDKANVLETSRLWRQVVSDEARAHPEVALDHILVDNCALQLVREPRRFDVILTENLFGDILSDEAAALVGSIGMLPSASIGGKTGLYEPVHGSAPDLAGRDAANPVGAILSVAMMLRWSLRRADAADAIERAVERVLESGPRTADLGGTATCSQVGSAVAEALSG
jgi:3-isopropylmalate dehydrogenase